MPMRMRFSENLRKFSLSKGSYSQVARDLGLNRQQFADYISGKSLPNEQIIKNILKYFNLDISDLFQKKNRGENIDESHAEFRLMPIIKKFLKNRENDITFIPSGMYYIYFKIDRENKYFLKSVMAVESLNGISAFRRISRERASDKIGGMRRQGVTSGVIFSSKGKVVIIGVDTINNYDISILVGDGVNSKEIIVSGWALVSAPYEYQLKPFAISPIAKCLTLREALVDAHIVSAESDSIPHQIREKLFSF
jgi:transcriptional regulator with XRE-family HTH domain